MLFVLFQWFPSTLPVASCWREGETNGQRSRRLYSSYQRDQQRPDLEGGAELDRSESVGFLVVSGLSQYRDGELLKQLLTHVDTLTAVCRTIFSSPIQPLRFRKLKKALHRSTSARWHIRDSQSTGDIVPGDGGPAKASHGSEQGVVRAEDPCGANSNAKQPEPTESWPRHL